MIAYVELERIGPNPWQTRGEPSPEHVKALAEDIEKNGLLQRPVGRLLKDGQPIECNLMDAIGGSGELGEVFDVQLAFGHNRLEAFRLLAEKDPKVYTIWRRMPVEIFWLDDEKMAQAAWSENERRRDLTPIERARAIQKRMADFSWTQEQAAERLELSRTTVSNILRLLELPENLQEALGSGDLSERSAMALLPLYDVPEEIRKVQLYSWQSPERIVEEALDGASSEAIRKKVNDYFGRSFQSLHESEVKIAKVFPEGGAVYCGTCQACDRRIASRNLCMDRGCYEMKVQLTRHKYLEAASLASGYDIIDEGKGGVPSLLPNYPDRLDKILATKCPNLRLAYDVSGNGRDDPRRIPGYPKALLVCDKRNGSCTCLNGITKLAEQERPRSTISDDSAGDDLRGGFEDGIEETQDIPVIKPGQGASVQESAPSPADLEDVMRKARKDKREATAKYEEVTGLVIDLLARELAEDHPGAFYLLIRRYTWPRDGFRLEELYREGARNIAQHVVSSNYDGVDDLVGRTNEALERLGLPAIHLEKTLVEVFEAEV